MTGSAATFGDLEVGGTAQAATFHGKGAQPVVLEGATEDEYELTFEVTDPTADRIQILPDATGTILISGTASVNDLSDAKTGIGLGDLFIGESAGSVIESSGEQNTGIGINSMAATTTGDGNTATGAESLIVNSTGQRNTAIGFRALYFNTIGSFNTAVGTYSLGNSNRTIDELVYNTAIGHGAGFDITTGQYNVIIGAEADASAGDAENQIVIGYGTIGTGDNEIALGNTSITAIKAQVNSITAYSDERIKRDIRNSDLGLTFINRLRPVKYRLKNPADYPEPLLEERFKIGRDPRPEDDETVYDGLIAQEVKTALDDLGMEWSGWSKDEVNGKQAVQYGALVVPLIKAVQELSKKVDELEGQISNLQSENTMLMGKK
jgi:hypothetical protein